MIVPHLHLGEDRARRAEEREQRSRIMYDCQNLCKCLVITDVPSIQNVQAVRPLQPHLVNEGHDAGHREDLELALQSSLLRPSTTSEVDVVWGYVWVYILHDRGCQMYSSDQHFQCFGNLV